MKDKRTLLFLFIIILLGGTLRFAKLDYQSLWNDELSSLSRTRASSLVEVIKESRSDVHPPFYYCLLYLWQNTFGNSPFSIRFLSAIFGALSIVAIFFLGRQLYSEQEALISALILSLSFYGIYYSQEARSYSLLLLLSMCSYLFFIKIQPQQSRANESNLITSYVCYILFTTLLIYTHYFGVLVFFSQFIFILLSSFVQKREKGWFKPFLSQILVCLLYLPQISTIRANMNIAETWIRKPHFDFFIQYFNKYWGSDEAFFLLASLCIFCFFYFRSKKSEKNPEPGLNSTLLVVVWAAAPLIIAYGRSVFSTPILTDRNTIIVLAPLILMMARGITSIKNRDILIVLIAALSIAGFYSLFITNEYYYRVSKEQFREVADTVMENKNISEQSLIVACAWNPYYFDYFFEQAQSPFRVDALYEKKEDISNLEALIRGSRKKFLWYLIGHKYPSQEALQYLENNYKLLGTKQFNKSSFFLFVLER
ncbi:MAG: glycosyltransferase family 39 protein [bacterium]